MFKKIFTISCLLSLFGWFAPAAQGQNTFCAGEEVCLTVPARGYVQWLTSQDTMNWTGVANGDTACITIDSSGWYRAWIVEGTCDTIWTDAMYLTVYDTPIADAGTDTAACVGSGISLNGSASGGTPVYQYTWAPVAGLSDPGIPAPALTVSTTTTYVLTVTDLNGCTDTDSVTVTALDLPTVNAGNDTSLVLCSDTAWLNGSATGGAGGYSYLWTPGNGLSANNVPNPYTTPGDTFTYTLTVTDSMGCSGSDDVIVNVADSGATGPGSAVFSYTGAAQWFVVPPCVDTVFIQMWGAQGGDDPPTAGGQGGYSEGYLAVSPGDTLWIYVGGSGTDGPGSGQNCGLLGGWNGGGNTGDTCCSNAGGGAGAGGGGSDVRYGGNTLSDRVIVAGGGGGAGSSKAGAAGGGLVGNNGDPYNSVPSTGGTQSAGGTAGGHYTFHTCNAGTDGGFGYGGMGDGNDGGGGGGGWYGGGGGANNAGGAGGSGYIGGVVNGNTTTGGRIGDGEITVSW